MIRDRDDVASSRNKDIIYTIIININIIIKILLIRR